MLHTTQLAKCNAFARAHKTLFRRVRIYGKAEPKAGPCGPTKRVRSYRQAGLIMATVNGQQQTLQRDSAPVVVVTTLGCQYCKRAKEALQQAGIPFEEVEAGSQLDLLHTIKRSTGKSTVPQIFAGGQLLGGSDDLLQLISQNKLSDLLQNAQGKPALPQELQAAVDAAKKASISSTTAAFVPPGMTSAQYTHLQQLAADMQSTDSRLQRIDSTSRIFTAASFVKWLQQYKSIQRPEAQQLLTGLLQAHLVSIDHQQGDGTAVNLDADQAQLADVRLQLISEAAPPKFRQPLNVHYAWFGPAGHASEVSEGLRQIMLQLYDKHLSADGKALHYDALHKDSMFPLYVNATAELQRVDVGLLSHDEKMAFFINIYNAIVVHALAEFGPASNFLQKLSFFDKIKYVIGGQEYSANDMEHGILRGNRATPTNPWVLVGLPNLSSGYFKTHDPRAALAVQPMDPRIHFALVCGAKSCPPIKVYTATSLQEGLESATMAFCEGEVIVHRDALVVEMSKIFKWYKQDFGPAEDLLPWLVQHLTGPAKQDLQHLLDTAGPAGIKVKYRDYDWSINS